MPLPPTLDCPQQEVQHHTNHHGIFFPPLPQQENGNLQQVGPQGSLNTADAHRHQHRTHYEVNPDVGGSHQEALMHGSLISGEGVIWPPDRGNYAMEMSQRLSWDLSSVMGESDTPLNDASDGCITQPTITSTVESNSPFLPTILSLASTVSSCEDFRRTASAVEGDPVTMSSLNLTETASRETEEERIYRELGIIPVGQFVGPPQTRDAILLGESTSDVSPLLVTPLSHTHQSATNERPNPNLNLSCTGMSSGAHESNNRNNTKVLESSSFEDANATSNFECLKPAEENSFSNYVASCNMPLHSTANTTITHQYRVPRFQTIRSENTENRDERPLHNQYLLPGNHTKNNVAVQKQPHLALTLLTNQRIPSGKIVKHTRQSNEEVTHSTTAHRMPQYFNMNQHAHTQVGYNSIQDSHESDPSGIQNAMPHNNFYGNDQINSTCMAVHPPSYEEVQACAQLGSSWTQLSCGSASTLGRPSTSTPLLLESKMFMPCPDHLPPSNFGYRIVNKEAKFIFHGLIKFLNSGKLDIFFDYSSRCRPLMEQNSDIHFIIRYLESCGYMYRDDHNQCLLAISDALKIVPKTSSPNKFKVDILAIKSWLDLKRGRLGHVDNTLKSALQTYYQDKIVCSGKATGWIHIQDARRAQFEMTGIEADDIHCDDAIISLQLAMEQFKQETEVGFQDEGIYGYIFSCLKMVCLLLHCDENMRLKRGACQVMIEDHIKALELLVRVLGSGKKHLFMHMCSLRLALSDYNLVFGDLNAAEKFACDAFKIAVDSENRNFCQARYCYIQKKRQFDKLSTSSPQPDQLWKSKHLEDNPNS